MKQVRELSGCRKRSNLSQEAVAEKLGVSRQTLSRWERGETEIPAQYLPKLAELYGVSINELLEEIYGVTDKASVATSTETPEKPGEQTEVTLASTVQKPSRRYIIALCSMAAVIVLLAGLLILASTDRNKQQMDSIHDVQVDQKDMDIVRVDSVTGSEFDLDLPGE